MDTGERAEIKITCVTSNYVTQVSKETERAGFDWATFRNPREILAFLPKPRRRGSLASSDWPALIPIVSGCGGRPPGQFRDTFRGRVNRWPASDAIALCGGLLSTRRLARAEAGSHS